MIFIKNAKRYFKKCVEIKLNCLKKREGEHDVLERVVEQVLSKVDIVDVVSMYVPLKKVGVNFRALCPFHQERTPSFYVSPAKQIFHCFGCGVGGNAIHFVMRIENLTFTEALKVLAGKAKIDVDFSQTQSSKDKVLAKQKEELISLHNDCLEYFQRQLYLRENMDAARYVLKRGIRKETAKQFGLGFCPEDNNLYEMLSRKYSKEIIDKSGIFIERNGKNYCRFEGRLIFPIFDTMNRVIGFGGRIIEDSQAPKYMNSPDTLIFSKSKVLYGLNIAKSSKEKDFVIVEGYMDVISLHQEGIDNVVGVLGTALTQDHSFLLRRYKNEVVLCLDSDQAGRNATFRSADILYQNGLIVKVMELENAKDPDEYIKKFGKDAFLLKKQNAMFAIDFKVKQLSSNYDLSKSDQKFRFVREYFEKILMPITNEVERQEYIRKLSQLTQIDEEAILKEFTKNENIKLKRLESIQHFKQVQQKSNLTEEERIKKNDIDLLSIYVEWANKSESIRNAVAEDDFCTEDIKMLFSSIKNLINEGMELTYSMLLTFVNDEKILSELTSFSSKGFETEEAAKRAIEELKTNNNRMLWLKREMLEAQKRGDTEKVLELQMLIRKIKDRKEGI
ncbi:DNA primase [Caldicellulosiruptor bescii]|uniref:DNA primase n=2 Tax=Caldicellulosiruptor bescii TaxID=31899 RepID=B9MQ35_CALBD|nr:DNA primase [Caldicellulosiruptor bescii]ACM59827.1 DNA primase [Caldicellulosiruptor bescii DSM 6725]PBC87237.1 DNA primase [Caldicellulosiruptor bescii]PBC90176.1 DNA primase [Caldicellulosiruptor bescii]PBD04394.1 DNA primase [Caldicellulosiruptor bescii]PBD05973.1 DNA primase [Caldicellulosiruptor bescii]